jgi:iron complex outermembrane receptor protein
MGGGDIGLNNFQLLAGYTFTQPVSLSPEFDYYMPNEGVENLSSVSYLSSSSDTTGHILKYRMQHLVRADIAWRRGNITAGFSARYNSYMQNIDKIFTDLETNELSGFNPGLTQWRAEHTTGDVVFDCRLGYTLMGKHRLAVVVNNLLNREYAIRPLAIEQPRLVMLQYTLTL